MATFGADCKGGANAFNSYWCSKQATAWSRRRVPSSTPATRQQMYNQIQQIIYQQSPFVVIDYSPYRYGVGSWVHGFHVDAARQLRPVTGDADGIRPLAQPGVTAQPGGPHPAARPTAKPGQPQGDPRPAGPAARIEDEETP